MVIEIDETNGFCFKDSALKDIGAFKNLPSWLLAIKNNKVAFAPLDCGVKINNKWLMVVEGGQLSDKIDTIINRVKKIPAKFRNFPNDYTEIKVDTFERELFFNTNYVA